MRVMTQELVTSVFSDGWTDVDHHPIVNVIMVSVHYTLRVFPLTLWCMDGVYKGVFVLIQKVCPRVQCFV